MNPTTQVRDLQKLIAEQQAAVSPQQALIDEQIAANAASGTAQEAGLRAQQQEAFGNIEQGAQNNGMFFSGFSPAEQARYTSTSFLPKMAELQQTIAAGRANLMGKKADLNTSVFDKATAMRENDLKTVNEWNQMTAQQQFNASEADKDRAFKAQQSAADRDAAVDNKPTTDQFLVQAFSGYDPATMQNYTEREVIPALMANYGIDKNAAAALAYSYRKSNYNQ